MAFDMERSRPAVAAEFLGTSFLVMSVVGSGIMAERLSNGNGAVALLANAIATGAALLALIATFAPISGAHFNPVVTTMFCANDSMPWRALPAYVSAQCSGAVLGTALANFMFGLAPLHLSHKARLNEHQFVAEIIATFGLLTVIWAGWWTNSDRGMFTVSAYIIAAYWFTSSTSFANPAVTIGRIFSDTFAGIRFPDATAFIGAQCIGMVLVIALCRRIMPKSPPMDKEVPILERVR
jgi:glycerol uptake facilitator-like aquaporin